MSIAHPHFTALRATAMFMQSYVSQSLFSASTDEALEGKLYEACDVYDI